MNRMQDRLDELDLYGQRMGFDLAERVTTILLATLGLDTTVKRYAVSNSVLSLSGMIFEHATARTLIRRIASSLDALEQGQTVNAGSVSRIPDGWYVLQILDVVQTGSYLSMPMNIDYGPCSDVGFDWHCRVGDRQVMSLWRRLKLPKTTVGQWQFLTQMRTWAWLQTFNGVLSIRGTRGDTAIISVNREIVKMRQPPCVHRYNRPCVKCPIGYDQCPAGCRRVTLKVRGNDTDQNAVFRLPTGEPGPTGVDEPDA